jgi:uncharacterized protein YkwD
MEVAMARSKFRRVLRFENLESRQVLSGVGPTAQEQYMLQLINEARTDPAAAAQRIAANDTGTIQATLQYYGVNLSQTQQAISSAASQPPLAWNDQLASAAQSHSQDMANSGIQSHTGSDGSSPSQRIQQSGYTNASSNAENVYSYATSVDEAMEAFLIDWGVSGNGHRNNLLQPGVSAQNAFQSVGIGLVNTNNNSSYGPLVVTQDFGAQSGAQAQVVGVAFYDNNGNRFYAPGEGQGNVQIDAVNLATGQVFSTQTWDSGGYELSLAPGQYRLIASVNDEVVKTADLTVGSVNIEQDVILSDTWQGGSRESAIAAAQPQVNPPAPAPQPAPAQPTYVPVPIAPINWNWSNWSAKVS